MKALVLLHGWGVGPAGFDALRETLDDEYEVHAPALPGYDGTHACRPYDLRCVAECVAAAAPARCFVAGWSLGGQIALAWSHAAPQQVERMALIATSPCFVQREAWSSAMAASVFRDFAAALERDAVGTLRRFASLQAQGDLRAKQVMFSLRAVLAAPGETEPAALRSGLDILRDADLRPLLHAIAQETLVIHGEHDALVPLAAGEYLAASLAHAALHVIPGAGHAPLVSDAGAVARSLRGFFA